MFPSEFICMVYVVCLSSPQVKLILQSAETTDRATVIAKGWWL